MARLLVGYDGSPPSRRAFDRALVRAKDAGDELVVVAVIPPSVRGSSLARMMPAGIELPRPLSGTFEDHTRERMDEVMAEARKAGVKVEGEVRAGSTVDAILAAAHEHKADEILLGVKSYEGPEAEVGPNATEIARKANVPVTLVP
jgi:nucleotide-binding universal stress UspA family protein